MATVLQCARREYSYEELQVLYEEMLCEISSTALDQSDCSTFTSSCKTVIGMHEMHGRMHPN